MGSHDGHHYVTADVAIIGGGPAGSTCATLLRKYNPSLHVLVLEKERFPREHIGESQLPSISAVLDEMGAWDKVEAAGFPIKIGATFTWGREEEPWDLDFYPPEHFVDEPRPAKYRGQRLVTAFQVDRAIYDDILLRHAQSVGADVRQETRVERVLVDGDRVEGLELASGGVVRARHYVDGSGTVGFMRRALGIESHAPKELRNIAMWDYWENAEWAIKIGVGGTRIQVRSLPYGWMWFIPLGPTRTSIGLVCPASYYKSQGMSPTELYRRAVASEPDIARLTRHATPTGDTRSIKDWSHCSARVCGTNWFIMGEAAGFADPILSAGMALAHGTGREVAYSILELERGELDGNWIRERYDTRTRRAIGQHIRFAQYWYSVNARFTDLKDECKAIAREGGLALSPIQAWRWLAQGGFANHSLHNPQLGSFDVFSARFLVELFAGRDSLMSIESVNELSLNLHGATKRAVGDLRGGRIALVDCYAKGDMILPLTAPYTTIMAALERTSDAAEVFESLKRQVGAQIEPAKRQVVFGFHLQALEVMLNEGWIVGKVNKKRPFIRIDREGNLQMRPHREGLAAIEQARERRREVSG